MFADRSDDGLPGEGGDDPTQPAGSRRHRAPAGGPPDGLRSLAVAVLAGGVLVGLLWALVAPVVVAHSDQAETQASGDTTLALLEVLAGVVTAAALAWRPGRQPAARFAVALVGVVGAAFLSWAVGEAAHAPALHAIGVVLIWPFVAAGLTVVRVVVDLVMHGET